MFWTLACFRSNGYFGCQDNEGDDGKLESHGTRTIIRIRTMCLMLLASDMVSYHRETPIPHGGLLHLG